MVISRLKILVTYSSRSKWCDLDPPWEKGIEIFYLVPNCFKGLNLTGEIRTYKKYLQCCSALYFYFFIFLIITFYSYLFQKNLDKLANEGGSTKS